MWAQVSVSILPLQSIKKRFTMKKFFSKKTKQSPSTSSLTARIYNPFRDRIRKHISDINDVITDEDLRNVNIMQIVKQGGSGSDLAIG